MWSHLQSEFMPLYYYQSIITTPSGIDCIIHIGFSAYDLTLIYYLSFGDFAGPYMLQSQNFPTYMIGYNQQGEASITLQGNPFYLVKPGLSGSDDTVSLEAADKPRYHLRHYGYLMDVEDRNNPRNPGIFHLDASFNLRRDQWTDGFITFEAVNVANYYIRHQGYRLKISANDNSDLFQKDAGFQSVEGRRHNFFYLLYI